MTDSSWNGDPVDKRVEEKNAVYRESNHMYTVSGGALSAVRIYLSGR